MTAWTADQLPRRAFLAPDIVGSATTALAGGPYPDAIDAITGAAAGAHRYPQIARNLHDAVGRHHGIDAAAVALAAGTAAVIHRLLSLSCTAAAHVVIYGGRDVATLPGPRRHQVTVRADGGVDLDATLGAIGPATRAVIVDNPHNPTGTLLHRAALRRFLTAVPDDVLVILDESDAGFSTAVDAACGPALARERWAAGRPGVAVVRTLSMVFGLAGLRGGYVLAAPPLAASIRVSVPDHEIGSIAQAAAIAARAAADVAARCDRIGTERHRVENSLRELGFPVSGSPANFVWLPLRDWALGFAQHALGYGIRVMPFAGAGVRVTIGTPQDNTRFLAAAAAWPAATRSPVPLRGGDAS